MNYYILSYTTGENYLEERVKFRKEHLNHATEYFNEGYLTLGGAIDSAMKLFWFLKLTLIKLPRLSQKTILTSKTD